MHDTIPQIIPALVAPAPAGSIAPLANPNNIFICANCIIFFKLVNISSIWGHISKEFRASYSASKFGLDGMTISISAEFAQYGILANSIGPGFINTDLTKKILGETGIKNIESNFTNIIIVVIMT